MKNTTDYRPDDPALTASAEFPAPVAEKGRLKITLTYATPRISAFTDRLCQIFFITGLSLLLAGCGVGWCSHWMFGEILSPQFSDPQAKHVMAIWNVLMYFVPGTMIATGAALAFVPSLMAVIFALLPALVISRSKPAQD